MSEALRILILEDQPADADLITQELRKAGFEFVAKRVATEKEFLAELRDHAPELILSDYSLPGYDGLLALAAAQEQCPETPFILVSGSMGEERAVETLRRGATDYVLKVQLARLGPAVRRALREREERRKRENTEKKRHEAEARYHTLFDQSPDGIVIMDPETARPLEFNAAAHQQLGYSREEFARLSLADIEAAETPEQTRATIDGVRSDGKRDFETRQRTREGQIRHVHVTAQIVEASGRSLYHCIWRDITARKQAEQRVQELNLVLHATGAINALMVRERDPKRLLAEACKILVETRGYQLAWIGQVEPGSKRVVPAASAGKNADYLDAVTITWDETPTGQGPIGTAMRTGQPVACQDTATDPRFAPWRAAAMAHGFASVAAMPMIQDSRVLGAIAVYSERPGAFNAEEVDLLKELAGDLAFALQSIEHEEERKRAELRTTAFAGLGQRLSAANTAREAGEIIVDVADKLLRWDACLFDLYSAAENRITHVLNMDLVEGRRTECKQRYPDPAPRTLSKQAIEQGGQLILRDQPESIRPEGSPFGDTSRPSASIMFVPVRHRTKVVGVLSIQSYTPRAYDAYSLETLQALADHGGGALERLRAQEALSESEANFRSVWDHSIDGMRLTDKEGRIIAVNEAFCQLIKLPREKLEGQIFSVAYKGHGPKDGIELYQKRFATGDIVPHLTARVQLHSGEEVDLEISSSIIELGQRGQAMLSVFRDVSERKRAEVRIEAFSSLGQRLSAAKTAREAAGIISEVASDLLGWDACFFGLLSPGRDLLDGVLNVDTIDGQRVESSSGYEPASAAARRAIETGGQLFLNEKPNQRLLLRQLFGNSIRPSASMMFVPVRKGAEVVGVMSIQSHKPGAYDSRSLETLQTLADHCSGALDRLRMEAACQTTQQRLGHLLMQSPAVIYSLSTDGKTTEPAWVSDNVERLLGYTVAECHGPDSLFDQLHPQDRQGAIDGFIRLLLNRQIARDYRVRHKNGEYRWVRDEQRLICDAGGAPVEIVGSWVDITEQKAVQEQLRQSQKMEAVGQLAGGVAHDFNNMLAVIRGNAELLLMDAGQYPAGAREGLERVVEASARAANLTRQLLAFSRKQVLQLQPLVLNEVIANLTKMLTRLIGENINLQCLYAAPLPYVQADTSMMEQVILNLVVNARDAMPKGGLLRVTTEHVSLDEAHARVNPEARAGEFVCLLVSDTGTGIAPEVLPRIFEPFFTTKELGKGTGLGLATVYGIVQQHQGWIEVSSQVGEGSTFKVFLPAIPTPARPVAAAKAGAEIRGGKETILLVEDEPTVRLVTRRVLESNGYTIREATSAREALEVWQGHAAEIALLLTDIIMPEEMTGRVLAEQLWKQRPGLKVIFMSGYSAEVLGKGTEFIRRTRSYFLQKPCSSHALLQTVRRCLDEKESVAASKEAGRTA